MVRKHRVVLSLELHKLQYHVRRQREIFGSFFIATNNKNNVWVAQHYQSGKLERNDQAHICPKLNLH